MVLRMLLCLIYILYVFAMCTSNGVEVMVHSGETFSHTSSPQLVSFLYFLIRHFYSLADSYIWLRKLSLFINFKSETFSHRIICASLALEKGCK